MPGFGPAAELAPWRVPQGATFGVEQKDPITVTLFETNHAQTPSLAIWDGTNANLWSADQLASLR